MRRSTAIARHAARRAARRDEVRRAARTIRAGRLDVTVTTRVVKDRRWVHRDQLEIGMCIDELDRPWSDTGFMLQGFRIDSAETLRAVRDACEHALIESEKLARIVADGPGRLVGGHRPSR